MPTPKEEKWQLEEVGVVHFGFGKFNLKSAEAKKLDDMVEKLKGESKEVFLDVALLPGLLQPLVGLLLEIHKIFFMVSIAVSIS